MRAPMIGTVLVLSLLCAGDASAWSARQARASSERNRVELNAGGYNTLTRSFDARRTGDDAMTRRGKVWFSFPWYAGPGYVIMPGDVGDVVVVKIDAARYPGIYKQFVSGDPREIESALALVEGSAIMQGLIKMEETDGD